MQNELLNAVKERINLGYDDEKITSELSAAGYDNATIESVIATARTTPTAAEEPADQSQSVPQSTKLPGVFELFNGAIKYARGRLDLTALLIAPQLLSMIILFYFGDFPLPEEGAEHPVSQVTSIIISIVNIFLTFAVVYIVSRNYQSRVSISDSISWVKKNFWAFVWIMFIVGAAVTGGFLLLIVPGVIMGGYLFLSQFVFAREGLKGMDALMRSRELVRGNWLPVFGRTFGVGILFTLLILAVFLVIVILIALVGPGETLDTIPTWFEFASGTLAVAISSFLTVAGLFVSVSIYSALSAAKPTYNAEAHTDARKKYKVLAWLGPILLVGSILIAAVFGALDVAQELGEEASVELQENTEGN